MLVLSNNKTFVKERESQMSGGAITELEGGGFLTEIILGHEILQYYWWLVDGSTMVSSVPMIGVETLYSFHLSDGVVMGSCIGLLSHQNTHYF